MPVAKPKKTTRRMPKRSAAVATADGLAARLDRLEQAIESLAARQSAEFARLNDAIGRNGSPVPAPFPTTGANAQIGDSDEAKILKRKYRRAQADAERLRGELAEAQRQLALVRAAPTPIAKRVVGKISRSIRQLLQRVPRVGKRLERNRRLRELEVITGSELFDPDWYLETYPDIAAAGLDPAMHYLSTGWLETRDPGPDFSTSGYLKANSDVARSGGNPLLHYIEYGMGEGRSVGVGIHPRVRRSTEKFDPPAPCFLLPVPAIPPVQWRRCHAIARAQADHVSLDNIVIGSALGSPEALAPALSRLSRLIDKTVEPTAAPVRTADLQAGSTLPQLSDCWFVRELTMRMHWSGKPTTPRVVRILQWTAAEGLRLVGEGLVAEPTDFIDLELYTAFHPLLLVFTTPGGDIVGGDVLAFPSLCRGGVHYAELGRPGPNGNALADGFAARSRSLEDAWLALAEEDVQPLLRGIQVDLHDSDGSEPILQNEMQAWLADILKVGLATPVPLSTGDEKVAAFLMDKATSRPPRCADLRRNAPATLVLPAKCVPTIAILVSSAINAAPSQTPASVSVICAADDPALGGIAAILPPDSRNYEAAKPAAGAIFWPQLVGACPPAGLAGGVRPDSDLVSDARLLEPTSRGTVIVGQTPRMAPITVVLVLNQWAEDALMAALQALRSQSGADIEEICCLGQGPARVAPTLVAVASVPVRFRPDTASLLAGMQGDLLLYIGGGVILHDPRTLAALADLALGDGTAAAACPLVTHSRRGRDWSIAVEDAGAADGEGGVVALAGDATRFWNTTLPLVRLPSDLWLARKSALDGATTTDDRLILSTQVTASYCAARDSIGEPAPLSLPIGRQGLRIDRWLA